MGLSPTERVVVEKLLLRHLGTYPVEAIAAWMGDDIKALLPGGGTINTYVARLLSLCEENELYRDKPFALSLLDRSEFTAVDPGINALVVRLRAEPTKPPRRILRLARKRWLWLVAPAIALLVPISMKAACAVQRYLVISQLRAGPATSRDGMRFFPGGLFTMGSTPAEMDQALTLCRSNAEPQKCSETMYAREGPVHERLLQPFLFDVTEVTTAKYADWLSSVKVTEDGTRVVLDGRPLFDRVHAKGLISMESDDGGQVFWAASEWEDRPAVGISWHGARAFCQAVGKRLPTEAEWESVARSSASQRFPWGQPLPGCAEVRYGWPTECPGSNSVVPVGTSPRDHTPEGIVDLGGNVSEWVEDGYSESYPDCQWCLLGWCWCSVPQLDGAAEPQSDLKVLRGANWASSSVETRASERGHDRADSTWQNRYGFRCAATP